MEHIDKSSLETTSGQFAIIVNNDTIIATKHALESKEGFLNDINDLVVVRQRSNMSFTIYNRDENTNSKAVAADIWQKGKSLLNHPIFVKNRLHNLYGKMLRITSFENPPKVYKSHPDANTPDSGFEVGSYLPSL